MVDASREGAWLAVVDQLTGRVRELAPGSDEHRLAAKRFAELAAVRAERLAVAVEPYRDVPRSVLLRHAFRYGRVPAPDCGCPSCRERALDG